MARQKVVIDPLTRIEGHLRITAAVENGKVVDAWTTCTLFRGFEVVMTNREPADCWQMAMRICGVCPTPHGVNAAVAAERAMGLEKVPENAVLVRNMLLAAMLGYDHILWFYVLNAFDYVNVPDALNAKTTDPELKALQEVIKANATSGLPGILSQHVVGQPQLPADAGPEPATHRATTSRASRRSSGRTRRRRCSSGKFPHVMTLAAGGMTTQPTLEQVMYYQDLMTQGEGVQRHGHVERPARGRLGLQGPGDLRWGRRQLPDVGRLRRPREADDGHAPVPGRHDLREGPEEHRHAGPAQDRDVHGALLVPDVAGHGQAAAGRPAGADRVHRSFRPSRARSSPAASTTGPRRRNYPDPTGTSAADGGRPARRDARRLREGRARDGRSTSTRSWPHSVRPASPRCSSRRWAASRPASFTPAPTRTSRSSGPTSCSPTSRRATRRSTPSRPTRTATASAWAHRTLREARCRTTATCKGGMTKRWSAVPASNWNFSPQNDAGVRGPVEAGDHRNAVRQRLRAARDPPDRPYLRSLNGLRGSRD